MKQLKMVITAILTLICVTTVNAQTKKQNNTKNQKSIAYQCPMKCEGNKTYEKAGKCPVCNMNLKEIKNAVADTYSCPMKCEGTKTYEKTGQCPKCNMNLKKVKTDKAK